MVTLAASEGTANGRIATPDASATAAPAPARMSENGFKHAVLNFKHAVVQEGNENGNGEVHINGSNSEDNAMLEQNQFKHANGNGHCQEAPHENGTGDRKGPNGKGPNGKGPNGVGPNGVVAHGKQQQKKPNRVRGKGNRGDSLHMKVICNLMERFETGGKNGTHRPVQVQTIIIPTSEDKGANGHLDAQKEKLQNGNGNENGHLPNGVHQNGIVNGTDSAAAAVTPEKHKPKLRVRTSPKSDSGSSDSGSEPREGEIAVVLDCPEDCVGRLIGKNGVTVKNLQMRTGVRIFIDQDVPEGTPRKVKLVGNGLVMEMAQKMVQEVIAHGPPETNRRNCYSFQNAIAYDNAKHAEYHHHHPPHPACAEPVHCDHCGNGFSRVPSFGSVPPASPGTPMTPMSPYTTTGAYMPAYYPHAVPHPHFAPPHHGTGNLFISHSWTEHQTAEGKRFFYNRHTGQSSWVPPSP